MRRPKANGVDPFLGSKQTGASLAGVIIGAALLLTFVYVFQDSWVNMSRSQKAIRSAQNVDQIEALISREFTRVVTNKTSCLVPGDFAFSMSSSFGQLQTTVQQSQVTGSSSAVQAALLRNSNVNAAATRCLNQTLIADVNNPTQSALRFCLRFTPDTDADRNSFLASEGAFAEVTILLRDNRSDQPLSCQQFLGSPHSGARIYYSIYWTSEIGPELVYRTKNGFIFVGRGH